ncbi:E3 ubiquitin-protein ligase RNF8-like [Venturia canescens]|uniref:E3 ubiquitin-protein ligase RNF8-like n=1 Tax=Venturia canescens TaxID=32260 RepID=UPI001C9BFFC4|nr:E3 ubiquitin-protein ligase RNF8-like [Venturia canescens]
MESLKRSMNDDDLEPVLVKLNKENSIFPDIHVDKSEFKIGRARNSDEIIAHVLISRNHAVVRCAENGDWTIEHLSSTITLLNDIPLELGMPKKLFPGDVIQFSASEEFKYEFQLCPKSLINNKRQKLNECFMETVMTQQKSFAASQETKRKELEKKLQTKQNEQIELKAQLDELLKNQELAQDKTQDLNNKILDLQKQIKAGNDAEIQLQSSYNDLLMTLETERKKFEDRLNEERRKWQTALDTSKQEKENIEKTMREQMDRWREQQQAEWAVVMENLVKQEKTAQERLLNEKNQLEQKLKETEDALKEQAALTEQLQSTTENVGNIDLSSTTAPECIFVQLLDDGTTGQMDVLETIDLTVDSPCSSSSNRDNGVINKVGDIMDEQLTCSICSEIFVKAVTLNCTHSFCHHCIVTWMKKKRDCPVCRAGIVSVNRSIVLDNFIEQMVETLTPQLQSRRKELLQERAALEKPFVQIKVKGRKK